MKKIGDFMRNLLQGFCIAVSMYSKLPVPMVEWEKNSLSFALCFFPVVGAFIGAAEIGWWYLAGYLRFGPFLRGAMAAAIPLLVTGGIHMDGFMDTEDARNSYGDREKKLAILKDAHLGAFAVIRFGTYFLLYAGLYSELSGIRAVCLTAFGCMMSRAWSAVGFVTCKPAKNNGLFYEFASAANKKAVLISNSLLIAVLTAAGIRLYPLAGVLLPIISGLTFRYYKRVSYREFGGITGDLAGYFLQLCELFLLAAAVLAERVL